MEHGSESYYVLGEGLLGESLGGREPTLARTAEAATPPFRFSRMGPRGGGKQIPEGTRKALADAMAVAGGGSVGVPAGFTYLGQFIDHDLTFDKTNVMLGEHVAPTALLQARSPSLDLDSLYGAGPGDPGSEQFYEADGLHLKMGKTASGDGLASKDGFDLPRGAGSTVAAKRKAIIPDPRNDENLAVAQNHLAMIRFHNRVIDKLGNVPAGSRFERARKRVTKHYQWMIRTDFLPRICEASVVNDVFTNGRKAFEVGAAPTDVPTMPIEFSVAAYRLGHSMVRGSYNWNKIFDDGFGTLDLLFAFSATSGDLGGFPAPDQLVDRRLQAPIRLPGRRPRDARRAGCEVQQGDADRHTHRQPAPVPPRLHGPGGEPRLPQPDAGRTWSGSPPGQQMVTFLKSKGISITKLTKAQLRDGDGGADLGGLTQAQRERVLTDTPLWFYILREAELNGGKLTGVGARIVAETFHRAMEGSEHSIVRDPAFRPMLGPNNTTFRMTDLLFFAFEGKKTLLAPLG